MTTNTSLLIGVPPGTRVKIPTTGHVVRLLSVNESRARVRIERSPNINEEGREQDWSPRVEVEITPPSWQPPPRDPKELRTSLLIKQLESLHRWVETLPRDKQHDWKSRNKLRRIIEGSRDIMRTGYTDFDRWVNQRPRRRRLLNEEPEELCFSEEGKKAVLELVDLTISELGAMQQFRQTIGPNTYGSLPVRKPRETSAAITNAMRNGRQKAAAIGADQRRPVRHASSI